MGIESAQLALVEALAGQQQVHVQRASESADCDEQFGEFRLLAEQFAELVDDDEQRGQWVEVRSCRAGLLVVADVGEVSGGAQHLLAAMHLTGQRIPHPVHQRRLLFQVGDDRGDVRDSVEAQESRSALEVDQDEVELIRRVGRDESEHERPQQLRIFPNP